MPKQRHNNILPRLFALRWVEVGGQLLVLWAAQRLLSLGDEQVQAMGGIIAALAGINILTGWRLGQSWPVTNPELFAQIAIDVLALGGLLYLSGGSANPFVSLFLLPLTITAAILPQRYTWAMASLSLASYTLLLFINMPLPPLRADLPVLDALNLSSLTANSEGMTHSMAMDHAGHNGPDSSFTVHLVGMWFNFLVSAGIITFFLARLANELRLRERELVVARENAIRHEQILALGTLAAGAAHQLGTPLATMAVVIGELEIDHADQPDLRADLNLLRRQVEVCKQTLGRLTEAAGQTRSDEMSRRPLDTYLDDLVDKWRLLRPRAHLTTDWQGKTPAPTIIAEPTLEQALLNVLDNAADASPTDAVIQARWDEQACVINILDRGPGISGSVAQQIGKPFFTTKASQGGLGIGLFLSNATLERLGGKVELFNREDGGACTRVTLPLAKLT